MNIFVHGYMPPHEGVRVWCPACGEPWNLTPHPDGMWECNECGCLWHPHDHDQPEADKENPWLNPDIPKGRQGLDKIGGGE